MNRKEEILRNKACRDLRKLKIYQVNGQGMYTCSMEELCKFYKSKCNKKLENRSRKLTKSIFKGYIYVINTVCDTYMKIGYSNTPKIRLSSIQTGCPITLKLIKYFEGNIPLEKELHKNLKPFKVRGEWFHYNEKAMKIVTDYQNNLLKIRYYD